MKHITKTQNTMQFEEFIGNESELLFIKRALSNSARVQHNITFFDEEFIGNEYELLFIKYALSNKTRVQHNVNFFT
jgi:hypothetical protein